MVDSRNDKTPLDSENSGREKALAAKEKALTVLKSEQGKLGLRVAGIVGGVVIGGYVLYHIFKPVVLSWAHYIVRLESQEGQEARQQREIAVEAERVEARTMPKTIDTVGELRANASVVIHSEISGRIKEISFVEGSKVNEGDPLIKFDDEQYQAEYRSSEAQYQAAKSEYERFKKMKDMGATSSREYDKAFADMNVAQAKMEVAAAQLKKTEIRAPFSGVIGICDVSPGAFVQPNQELVTLVDQTPIKVRFGIPGKYVNDVGIGQTVELKIDAYKDRLFRGTVEAVDSHVDTATNSVAVRASVPNEDGILKAGLFATVSLYVGEQSGTITVDEAAVERMGEQEYVWVIERGKARRAGVLTGARSGGRVEVTGLREGQIVVTAGQLRLTTDGIWVRVMNMDPNEAENTPSSESDSKKSTETKTSAKTEEATSTPSSLGGSTSSEDETAAH